MPSKNTPAPAEAEAHAEAHAELQAAYDVVSATVGILADEADAAEAEIRRLHVLLQETSTDPVVRRASERFLQ